MKTLKLKLKKDVLIVDKNDFRYYTIIDNEIVFNIKDVQLRRIKGNYKFLCKGSGLTEEIASELVQTTWIHDKKILCKYKNYNSEGDGSYFSAVKSFISAVESKGFYWLENPIKVHTWASENADEYRKKWQEAEEKTFKNPLIFINNYVQ